MSYVEVHGFSKAYGQLQAVKNLDLIAETSAIVALAGPDGAGKTTLFRALAGLLSFDSGSATIAGLDVVTQFNQIKPLLGYMPQNFSLYPDLSVEENLRFYSGLFGQSASEFAAEREKLYEFSGLGPFRARRAGALSGGMKQKLALSCALVHHPKLLLLDEPTTGVDPLSRRQFWEILRQLRDSGAAIIVSTPYMDEVALADRAIFIHKGERLAAGTPQELTREFRGMVFRLAVAPSAELVARINDLSKISARRFGASLHLHAEAGIETSQLAAELKRLGIEVAPEPIAPDLEDTFVQLMTQE
ncbi:MAG: ABC transporter ATP-binding protein [bacterium]